MNAVGALLAPALTPGQEISLWFGGAIILVAATAWLMKLLERARRQRVEMEADAVRRAAQTEAAKIVAEGEARAKSEFLKLRESFDKDTQSTRREMRDEEKRLAKREDLVDQKMETAGAKERTLEAAEKAVAERERALIAKDKQLNDLIARQKSQLLKVANLSLEEARAQVLSQTEKDVANDVAEVVSKRLDEARETAEAQAREVIVTAIQRYAAEHTAAATVSTVDIPSDDMKGRVIGREGRNIRAFEKATGVDVVVDDTPGVVVVSGFDPVRREVARRSLEKLIQDGRIHPARIEEIAANTEKEVNRQIVEARCSPTWRWATPRLPSCRTSTGRRPVSR